MRNLKKHKAYKMAREAFGVKFELLMLMEECSELTKAASKIIRYPGDKKKVDDFFEEIADVENLIHQMKCWYPKRSKYVDEIRIAKLDRLVERIENGEN